MSARTTVAVSARARNNALIELLNAVNAGAEYPDAHTAICVKYRLSDAAAQRLTEEYDALEAQFVKRRSVMSAGTDYFDLTTEAGMRAAAWWDSLSDSERAELGDPGMAWVQLQRIIEEIAK